jgi:hypothetical protein
VATSSCGGADGPRRMERRQPVTSECVHSRFHPRLWIRHADWKDEFATITCGTLLGLPLPSHCAEPEPGLPMQCMPNGGSCVNDTARIQPSVRCRTSDQCLDPRFPVCSLGQCIAPCERDADCSAPYDRCLRGRCAIAVVGAFCDSDADCGGTFDRCIYDLAPDGPVCTTRCRTDADCPFLASHCVTRGAERFCAPDRATSGAICRALVAAGRAIACDAGEACPGGARCYRAGDLALCLSPPAPEGCAGEDEILRHDAQGNTLIHVAAPRRLAART